MSLGIPDLGELGGGRRALTSRRGASGVAWALSGDCQGTRGGSEGWYRDRGGGMPPIRARGALRRAPGCANRTENGGGGSGGARTAPERRHRALELPRAPQSTARGRSPWHYRGGRSSTSPRARDWGGSVAAGAGAPRSQASCSVGGDPLLGEPERPARPGPRDPCVLAYSGPRALELGAACSGLCAVGVRGQRFAYCYGDCGRQPQPAGNELSVTRAGGPALGFPLQQSPGGGRDAAARGRIPSVPPPRAAASQRSSQQRGARQPRQPRIPLRW